jgi:hypothetical protein
MMAVTPPLDISDEPKLEVSSEEYVDSEERKLA